MPVPAPAAMPTPTAPAIWAALKRSTEPTSAAPTASAAASCPPVPETMPVTVPSGPANVVSVVAKRCRRSQEPPDERREQMLSPEIRSHHAILPPSSEVEVRLRAAAQASRSASR